MKRMFETITSQPACTMLRNLLALVLTSWLSSTAMAQNYADVPYVERSTGKLELDIYLPEGVENPPLVVWVHGGAWRFSDKNDPLALPIVSHGFALASLDFRQSTDAPFPAQLQDIKEAIRFLRSNAARYGYSANKLALWGHSSGGHLAALAGTTQSDPLWDDGKSVYQSVDTNVQAIVAMAAPTNLSTILHQSAPQGLRVREPALELLLDGSLEEAAVGERAKQASPVFQVDPADPPLLLMHGLQDSQVPVNQALELEYAYQEQGLHVESVWIPDADHGSPQYFDGPYFEQVVEFLRTQLE